MSTRENTAILLLLVLGGTTCVLAVPFLTREAIDWSELNLPLLLGSVALTLALLTQNAMTTSVPRALGLLVLAFGLGWLVEALGLASRFPFGAGYAYHPDLRPLLPGGVPLFIPLAWYVLTATGIVFLRPFSTRLRGRLVVGRWLVKTVLGGLYLVGTDLLLDPLAVSVGAWTWEGGGPYFDTPVANYVGWFGVGLVLFLLHLPWSEPVQGQRAARLDRVLAMPSALLVLLALAAVIVRVGSVWPVVAALTILAPCWLGWWLSLPGRRTQQGPGSSS